MALSAASYYTARVGFPNVSNSNGRYNSFAVTCAHTGMAEEVLAKSFTEAISENTDPKLINIPGKIQVNEVSRLRSLEILDILRGQKNGVLTEEDARVFYKTYQAAAKLYGEPIGFQPYINAEEIKSDPKREILKAAVNDPDWRVIRVQGNGHYWVFIRNVYGTVDVINDVSVTRNFMNLNGVIQMWSQAVEWEKTQIAFYPPKLEPTSIGDGIVYRNLELESVHETRPVDLENCIVKGNIEAPVVTMKRTQVNGNVKTGQDFSLDHVTIRGVFSYVLDPKNPNKEIHSSNIGKLHIECPIGFANDCSAIPLLDLRSSKVGETTTDDLENGIRILENGYPSRSITMVRKTK